MHFAEMKLEKSFENTIHKTYCCVGEFDGLKDWFKRQLLRVASCFYVKVLREVLAILSRNVKRAIKLYDHFLSKDRCALDSLVFISN